MKLSKSLVLAAGLSLSVSGQAQVVDVVNGLVGSPSANGTLANINGVTGPILGNISNRIGLSNSLPASLSGLPTNLASLSSSTPDLFANAGLASPRTDSSLTAEVAESLAGDLPAGLPVPLALLKPFVLDALLLDGIVALPAGALPADTMIPVASLDGLDPALTGFVTDDRIAASHLPEDLPIWSSALDESIVAQVLKNGIPASLLPETMRVQLAQLPGL